MYLTVCYSSSWHDALCSCKDVDPKTLNPTAAGWRALRRLRRLRAHQPAKIVVADRTEQLSPRNNIHSISKLLAADFISTLHEARIGADFDAAVDRHFSSIWNASEPLKIAVMMEAHRIHTLRSAIDEADSIDLGSNKHSLALIVHGTWAAGVDWWMPENCRAWSDTGGYINLAVTQGRGFESSVSASNGGKPRRV